MKKTFIIIFKISVTVTIVFFLGERIYNQYDKLYEAFLTYLDYPLILALVLLLMPINWSIECLKWKLSVRPIVNISAKEAMVGVLSGISLGFVTPHAVGDYFARIWSLKHQDRKKAIGPILLNRIAQLLPTVCFGSISLFVVYGQIKFPPTISNNGYPELLMILGLILLIFLIVLFTKYGKHFYRLKSYIDVMKDIAVLDYFKISALSFIRYGVFSVQFIILLSLFDLDITLANQFLGIAFIFLSKSVLPTFNFFNDLGVREFSAVVYFELFNIATGPIILASLLLWVINIALPAVLGMFFIRKFKIDMG